MKNSNRALLIILVMVAMVTIIGCSPIVDYQNSIFNDEDKIVKDSDSHTYSVRQGKSKGNETDIKFTSFSGTDTIFKITSDTESAIVFNFESIVDKGDFKVVLITPDDEIVEIVNGEKEGSETIKLKEGISRVKLVGRKSKGQIKMDIDAGEEIKIKAID